MATTQLAVVENIVEIPIDFLYLSKTNPRGEPDAEDLKDFAADIANRGVTQAILVRPQGERYEVVYGKRRFLGSKLAKKETVPSVIRNLTDDQVFELQIIENLQREDLPPLDEAAAFQRLYKKCYAETKNHDQAITQMSQKLGKKHRPEYIARRLKLNDLVNDAKQAFRKEQLILGHAEELARLREEEQLRALKWLLSRTTEGHGGKNVRVVPGVPELKVWIRQNIFLDLQQAPFDVNDAKLNPKMGACSSCQFKTGNQPVLFGDVKEGDTCTVPPCWREKRDNHLVQIANAAAQELGVSKVLKIGLGYQSWNHDKIPVDAYVEYDSPYRLVKTGDECKQTKAGIVTFIAHPSDAKGHKLGSQVFVCTNVRECPKHNPRNAAPDRSSRKSYEEMADTRVNNLRKDTPQRVRTGIIAAVIRAALKRDRAASKKDLTRLELIADQMHSDLFFDRHRDLCKLLEVEPSLDRYKNKDWRITSKSIFKGNPLAMTVAMTIMHRYHVGTYEPGSDPLPVFVKYYRVNATAIEKQVKVGIADKIEGIQTNLKRRKEKQAKAAKANRKSAKKAGKSKAAKTAKE